MTRASDELVHSSTEVIKAKAIVNEYIHNYVVPSYGKAFDDSLIDSIKLKLREE